MPFKIYHNPKYPLYSNLPSLFHPAWITRGALDFSFVRSNTTQFSRSFILAITRLWNDLPNQNKESALLQNFKCSANVFLLSIMF